MLSHDGKRVGNARPPRLPPHCVLSDKQEICSSRNWLPRPVEISLPSDDETLEALEGMLVSIKKPVVVDNYAAGTFGEITVAAERLWQYTQVYGCVVYKMPCGGTWDSISISSPGVLVGRSLRHLKGSSP